MKIRVDFSRPGKAIRPLHGVNNAPTLGVPDAEAFRALGEAGIPYSRLHDAGGMFGANSFVDIPNVFPDFSADENDPESYDFTFTDAYLAALVAQGVQPFYRLGVTIENFYRLRAYRIHPPTDYAKWARVCEHVISHYNEGWNNGFWYGIRYWEIWNEPENPMMWTGTPRQYFELYRVAANHLKTRFPEIRIGGYASCGFYAAYHPKLSSDPFYQSFLTFFEDFLRYITDPATHAPLDFFSWHIYTTRVEDVLKSAAYVRRGLDRFGLTGCESLLNEWNYVEDGDRQSFLRMRQLPGAAFCAAVMCALQQADCDGAMYYDAQLRTYGGLFSVPLSVPTHTYYTFKAFDTLYRLGSEAPCTFADAPEPPDPQPEALYTPDGPSSLGVYAAAAVNPASREGALLLVNYGDGRGEVRDLRVSANGTLIQRLMLDEKGDLTPRTLPTLPGRLRLPPDSVTLLRFAL